MTTLELIEAIYFWVWVTHESHMDEIANNWHLNLCWSKSEIREKINYENKNNFFLKEQISVGSTVFIRSKCWVLLSINYSEYHALQSPSALISSITHTKGFSHFLWYEKIGYNQLLEASNKASPPKKKRRRRRKRRSVWLLITYFCSYFNGEFWGLIHLGFKIGNELSNNHFTYVPMNWDIYWILFQSIIINWKIWINK